jgi:phosphoribosylformylglycinamidine synthase
MLGILEDKSLQTGIGFQSEDDRIYLLGNVFNSCINSSQYVYSYLGIKNTPAPYFNLEEEFALHQLVKSLIRNKAIASAHDVADGGLICTLLESGFVNGKGFQINKTIDVRKDAFLFGEAQGRVVVSVKEEQVDRFTEVIQHHRVFALPLGLVTAAEVVVDSEKWGTIEEFKSAYLTSIEQKMEVAAFT